MKKASTIWRQKKSKRNHCHSSILPALPLTPDGYAQGFLVPSSSILPCFPLHMSTKIFSSLSRRHKVFKEVCVGGKVATTNNNKAQETNGLI